MSESQPRRSPGRPRIDSSERVFSHPMRLRIVSMLDAQTAALSYMDLRESLRMTDGNLAMHIRKLEKMGYVLSAKMFVGRKPRTEYRVTPEGRTALATFLNSQR